VLDTSANSGDGDDVKDLRCVSTNDNFLKFHRRKLRLECRYISSRGGHAADNCYSGVESIIDYASETEFVIFSVQDSTNKSLA
jgi:hypothetical protein